MITRCRVLFGIVCLVLLVGILVWVTQDHEDALESGEQPITQPDEPAMEVTDDAEDSDANSTDTKPNVRSAEIPLELPEQPGESFAGSEPVADQTVSEQIVADQTFDNLPEVPPETLVDEPNGVTRLRESIQAGPIGRMTPDAVVEAFLATEGSQLHDLQVALSIRKYEVLPLIYDKLQTGNALEKRKITKLLRYGDWQELAPVLVEMAISDDEHELSRIGALYALGAAGNTVDTTVGRDISSILDKTNRSIVEKRTAISTLARIGYREAVPQIEPFLSHNLHCTRHKNKVK